MEHFKVKNKSIWQVLYSMNGTAFMTYIVEQTDNIEIETIIRDEFEKNGRFVSSIKLVSSSFYELD